MHTLNVPDGFARRHIGPSPGDRVYVGGPGGRPAGVGTYAELVVAPPDHLHPLPPGISFQQGAALGIPYATAYRALFQRGAARPSETVLVHGATGGVGPAVVQAFLALGATVVGAARRRTRLDELRAVQRLQAGVARRSGTTARRRTSCYGVTIRPPAFTPKEPSGLVTRTSHTRLR